MQAVDLPPLGGGQAAGDQIALRGHAHRGDQEDDDLAVMGGHVPGGSGFVAPGLLYVGAVGSEEREAASFHTTGVRGRLQLLVVLATSVSARSMKVR